MRQLGCATGSVLSALTLTGAGLMVVSPAAAGTGFHCSKNSGRSFAYKSGARGQPSAIAHTRTYRLQERALEAESASGDGETGHA